MELPSEVMVHNELVGFKGNRGTLLRVAPEGYYELNIAFGESLHRVTLPIATTALIGAAAETAVPADFEIER